MNGIWCWTISCITHAGLQWASSVFLTFTYGITRSKSIGLCESNTCICTTAVASVTLFREAKSQRTPRNLVWPSILHAKFRAACFRQTVYYKMAIECSVQTAYMRRLDETLLVFTLVHLYWHLWVSLLFQRKEIFNKHTHAAGSICTALEGLSLSVKTHLYRHIYTNNVTFVRTL